MDLAPYRVEQILEDCADSITKTALIGEALGQPYLVAIDEKTETQCEMGIMFFFLRLTTVLLVQSIRRPGKRLKRKPWLVLMIFP